MENPGTLRLRGDMNHAGMQPVFAESSTAAAGLFTLPFEWTMSGSWILEASLTLPSGETAVREFRYEILNEARADEMPTDDSAHQHELPMGGETSAVYMHITNTSPADVHIHAVTTTAAEQVEFHETVIENDIARMQPIDALLIPAGTALELRPGGKHIMLTQLTRDLLPNAELDLQIHLAAGRRIDLRARVLDMPMGGLGETPAQGLRFRDVWARTAQTAPQR